MSTARGCGAALMAIRRTDGFIPSPVDNATPAGLSSTSSASNDPQSCVIAQSQGRNGDSDSGAGCPGFSPQQPPWAGTSPGDFGASSARQKQSGFASTNASKPEPKTFTHSFTASNLPHPSPKRKRELRHGYAHSRPAIAN